LSFPLEGAFKTEMMNGKGPSGALDALGGANCRNAGRRVF